MHYLTKEFNQLVKYAQGLGVKVIFSNKTSGASAEWSTDGKEITIYNKDDKSPLALCLDLIHELSHHMAWIYNGRKGDLKTDNILSKEAAGLQLTELQRKHLYEMEKSDAEYQLTIHHEVGSKIPLWRLQAEIEVDNWVYKYFWQEGKWPNKTSMFKKRSEFIRKHKNINKGK